MFKQKKLNRILKKMPQGKKPSKSAQHSFAYMAT